MIKPLSSFPVYVVSDIESAKYFYVEYLGFTLVFSGDWYIHLVSESGVQIGFLLPDQATQPQMFRKAFDGSGALFSIEVEDSETAYSYAVQNDLNIPLELRSEDWGQKHFVIADPNGLMIDVVESFEPTDEYKSDYN